eukprot:423934_1
MNAVVEGTGDSGEDNVNDIDESSQFYQWMMEQKTKPSVIKKLIKLGYDSIDMIQSIEMEDVAEIVNEANLKGSEKINFKMIIKNLSNQHSFVDPEETKAIIQMEKKLKAINDSIQLIAETETKIDEQVANHIKIIEKTFKEFNNELNKRKTELINKLNKCANDKKNKLKNASKKLNQQSNLSKQQINSCHKSLKKAIEITQIEERKKGIIKIAKYINNVKI